MDTPLAALTVAAERQIGPAWWQVGIAFIGTVLLIFALLLNWRTLEITRESSQRQLRAYLGIEKIKTNPRSWTARMKVVDPSVVGATTKYLLQIEVKNFGQTPAEDVAVFAYWMDIDNRIRPPASAFENQASDLAASNPAIVRPHISVFRLYANQTHETDIPVFDPTNWQHAQSGLVNLYVWGRLYYRDCFGAVWVLQFCYLWQPSLRRFIPYEYCNDEKRGGHPMARSVRGGTA